MQTFNFKVTLSLQCPKYTTTRCPILIFTVAHVFKLCHFADYVWVSNTCSYLQCHFKAQLWSAYRNNIWVPPTILSIQCLLSPNGCNVAQAAFFSIGSRLDDRPDENDPLFQLCYPLADVRMYNARPVALHCMWGCWGPAYIQGLKQNWRRAPDVKGARKRKLYYIHHN